MFYHAMRQERLKHAEEQGQQAPEKRKLLMGRKANKRDLITKNRNVNTRNTLVCIFLTGTLIVGAGIALTCVGFIIEKSFPNPYNVTGITSTVVGVCILLMSVEIIVKSRREAMENEESGGSKKRKLQWSRLVSSAKVSPMPPTEQETRSWVNEAQQRSSWDRNQHDKSREVVLLPHVLEQDGY